MNLRLATCCGVSVAREIDAKPWEQKRTSGTTRDRIASHTDSQARTVAPLKALNFVAINAESSRTASDEGSSAAKSGATRA